MSSTLTQHASSLPPPPPRPRRRPRLSSIALALALAVGLGLGVPAVEVSASPLPTKTHTPSLYNSIDHDPLLLLPPPPPPPLITPFLILGKRNSVAVPANDTALTVNIPTATTNSTSDSTRSTTAAEATQTGNPISNLYGSGLPSSFLTWIAVVIAIGIGTSLLFARWFYIRRYSKPSLRSFFLPKSGLHIPSLRLHIKGPPFRAPLEDPPSYAFAIFGTRGARQRRRDRRTVGEGIDPDGARRGERDQDDIIEGEEVGEGLPGYEIDRALPMYANVLDQPGERDLGTMMVDPEGQEARTEVQIPSVQEYEMATRSQGAAAGAQGGTPTAAAEANADTPDSASHVDGHDQTTMMGAATYPPPQRPASSGLASSSHRSAVLPQLDDPSRPLEDRQDRQSTRSTIASSSHTKVEELDKARTSWSEDVHEEAKEGDEARGKEDDSE